MGEDQQRKKRNHVYRVYHLGLEERHKIKGDKSERHKVYILVARLLHYECHKGGYGEHYYQIAVPVEFGEDTGTRIEYGKEQYGHQQQREHGVPSPQQGQRPAIADTVLILGLV